MIIRMAEMKDKEPGIKLLQEHIKEFNFGNFDNDNTEYYNVLLENLIKDKTIIVAEEDGIINGVLIGARIPNLLNPHNVQLHILVSWVHKDKRGSSIFYRMNKYLEKNFTGMDIMFYQIPETNINFDRLGYKKFQTMHIKEK